MLGDERVVAIIPARAGSKRLPGKNILELAGLPMISWTILAARQSQYIDRIVVTTDSQEIATIAEQAGAEVPFIRPPSLADDSASSVDVIAHCLDFLATQKNDCFPIFVLLQPTSPLRDAACIDEAFGIFRQRSADSVVSVTSESHRPEWTSTLTSEGALDNFYSALYGSEKRNLDGPLYRLNGAIYVCRAERFSSERRLLFPTRSFGYPMPVEKSVDVDTLFDFKMAQMLLNIMNSPSHAVEK